MFITALSLLIENYGKNNFHAVILGSDQGRDVYSKKLLLGGSKETILHGKSGLLFNPEDAEELASIINKLMEMDKKSLSLIGEHGRKNVENKFNVDQMCQTTFTEYKKLIK